MFCGRSSVTDVSAVRFSKRRVGRVMRLDERIVTDASFGVSAKADAEMFVWFGKSSTSETRLEQPRTVSDHKWTAFGPPREMFVTD